MSEFDAAFALAKRIVTECPVRHVMGVNIKGPRLIEVSLYSAGFQTALMLADVFGLQVVELDSESHRKWVGAPRGIEVSLDVWGPVEVVAQPVPVEVEAVAS